MNETPNSGARRGRRSLRHQIVKAAAVTFEHKGFKSTTIDDIATAAKVARRTIYQHFKSKLDILGAVVLEQTRTLLVKLKQDVAVADDFSDYAVDCVCYIVEHAPESEFFMLQRSPDLAIDTVAIYFNSREVVDEWAELFREPYERALRKHQINPAIDLIRFMTWMGRITSHHLLYPLKNETPAQVRENLQLFFANALRYQQ